MALYKVSEVGLNRVPETSFAQERLLERADLQRLLKANISIIDPDLMVIAEEFGEWEDSNRRIDLLCLDRSERQLTVLELKRTEDGGHMELQAVRYAAMVSSMTFERLVGAHARYVGGDVLDAEAAILNFLGLETASEVALNEQVRVVLVSANFSREVTTTVLWLNKQGLDITCYRLKPYRLGSDVLIDIDQLIPLPEAADYETRLRAQRDEGKRVSSARGEILQRFWGQLIPRSRSRTSVVANRSPVKDHWLGGSVGRAGFVLNFVLNQHESQVECYVSFGRTAVHKAEAAYHALLADKARIQAAAKTELVWDDLPGKNGCRIALRVHGGWKSPEPEWASLQDELIDAMVRLEGALRGPISELTLPD